MMEENIREAIKALRQRYGVVGLNGRYLLAKDIDGDLRICPMGIMDKMYWDAGGVIANNFVKIKELLEK